MKKAAVIGLLCLSCVGYAQELKDPNAHFGVVVTPMFTVGSYKTGEIKGTTAATTFPATEMKYDLNLAGKFEVYVRADSGIRCSVFYETFKYSGVNAAKVKISDERGVVGLSLGFEF